MSCELASLSECSLFRRAGIQVNFIRARGLKGCSGFPDLSGDPEHPFNPRAQGSLLDWIL